LKTDVKKNADYPNPKRVEAAPDIEAPSFHKPSLEEYLQVCVDSH